MIRTLVQIAGTLIFGSGCVLTLIAVHRLLSTTKRYTSVAGVGAALIALVALVTALYVGSKGLYLAMAILFVEALTSFTISLVCWGYNEEGRIVFEKTKPESGWVSDSPSD